MEPTAFEGGYGFKWLIEKQINGDSSLAFNPNQTPVAPWLSWGPYLWANGLGSDGVLGGIPGRADGLNLLCDDFKDDGHHPADPKGRIKVSKQLKWFFESDSTSTPWLISA
eukprot:TRINITY_DN5571_c0_g1_i1.p1 TRINITY_DN5571_c0_g1~~TRINITY_DN5571_c0_g1_i1.p1  ORF type:complete len:111 (+),score=27.33 TRINITY_DN5571_c0_g1_i1:696-1028(+)